MVDAGGDRVQQVKAEEEATLQVSMKGHRKAIAIRQCRWAWQVQA